MINNFDVCLIQTEKKYPSQKSKWRASEKYPEYPFEEISEETNDVYWAVRESFVKLGMDSEHVGSSDWNPLGELITPGDNVLLKPNLVMDVNRNKGQGEECLYTQPSVVAAVVDYVVIALKGKGKIIIGDAPMQECVFDNIVKAGYGELVDFYKSKGVDIELVDFRELTSVQKNGVHVASISTSAKGKVIDLGSESEFYKADKNSFDNFRITNYDPRIMPTHHNAEKNEYYISDYILQADVIINLPKPKTHRKAGVTISLKNFVGANVRKEYLPHHTMGSVEENGDEYLKKSTIHGIRSRLLDKKNENEADKKYNIARCYGVLIKCCSLLMSLTGQSKYFEGSWYGNNTISRTITDINKIVFYADKNGKLCDRQQRKMLIVADMIVSGEEEGPVFPTAKPVGIIATGYNPVCFDNAIATVMGFDPQKIPTICVAKELDSKYSAFAFEPVTFCSNDEKYDKKATSELNKKHMLNFKPTSGWKGHIEI